VQKKDELSSNTVLAKRFRTEARFNQGLETTSGQAINAHHNYRPIRHHVAGYCHNSCLQILGSRHIDYFGGLDQLLDGQELLQDRHIEYQLDYREDHAPAEDGSGNLHNHPVEIVAEGGQILEQCLLQIPVERLE